MRNQTSFRPKLTESEAVGYAALPGFTPKDCEDAHHNGDPSPIQRALGDRWGNPYSPESIGEQVE